MAKKPKENNKEETEIEEIKKMSVHEKLMNIKFELLDCEIKKSGHNQFGKFDYYELKDMLPPVTRLCKKYRCLTHVDFPDTEYVILTLINVDDPEDTISVTSPRPPLKELQRMNIIQSEGSYQTYLRKYSYMAMFDITEHDTIDALDTGNVPIQQNQNNASAVRNNTGFTKASNMKKNTDELPGPEKPKPACFESVAAKCKELYPEKTCGKKLLNQVSFRMVKSNELTEEERAELYNYLFKK